MKLKCQCCGHEHDFKDAEEAFEAGWDAPPHFSVYVTCELCPASGLVLRVSHEKAHACWKLRGGRPNGFGPLCFLDDEWSDTQ